VENKKNEILSFLDPSIKLLSHISKMEGMPRVIALEILKETCEKLENISKGIIRLDQSTYYADIEECMKTATPGSEVQAINSLDSLRWSKNPRQARYLEANKKAASRGVKIHRIFVLRKSSLNDEGAEKKIENIREQLLQPGIEVDVVWLEQLNGFGLIEDWVYFSHPEPKLYVDYADQADRTQVVHADLYIVNNDIERKKGGFRKLIAHAIDEKERNSVFLKGLEINNRPLEKVAMNPQHFRYEL
jgi:hypothetical protein